MVLVFFGMGSFLGNWCLPNLVVDVLIYMVEAGLGVNICSHHLPRLVIFPTPRTTPLKTSTVPAAAFISQSSESRLQSKRPFRIITAPFSTNSWQGVYDVKASVLGNYSIPLVGPEEYCFTLRGSQQLLKSGLAECPAQHTIRNSGM